MGTNRHPHNEYTSVPKDAEPAGKPRGPGTDPPCVPAELNDSGFVAATSLCLSFPVCDKVPTSQDGFED